MVNHSTPGAASGTLFGGLDEDSGNSETQSQFVVTSQPHVEKRASSSGPLNQSPAAMVPLLDLVPGTVAVLRQVIDHQSRSILRSLGLTAGAQLRVCRIGDPCIIQVRSTRIGLSKMVAQSVYVAVAE